jgi:hypothetical protein
MSEALAWLEAIHTALRQGRPKPDTWFAFLLPTLRPAQGQAWLVAALSSGLDGEAEAVAERVRQRFEALGEETGQGARVRHWIHAALAERFDVDLAAYGHWLGDRKLTRDQAFALAAFNQPRSDLTATLRKIYKAISPWMVNQSSGQGARLSVYSAALVARGLSAEEVSRRFATAKSVFDADSDAKKVSDAGARACLALDADPNETLQRFRALFTAHKRDKHTRKIKRDALIEWAAEGLDGAGFAALAPLVAATAKHKGLNAEARIRTAYLLYRGNTPSEGFEPAKVSLIAEALAASAALAAAQGGGSGGDGGGYDSDGGGGGGGE